MDRVRSAPTGAARAGATTRAPPPPRCRRPAAACAAAERPLEAPAQSLPRRALLAGAAALAVLPAAARATTLAEATPAAAPPAPLAPREARVAAAAAAALPSVANVFDSTVAARGVPAAAGPAGPQAQGNGSGFVVSVSPSGEVFVATCAHVLAGALAGGARRGDRVALVYFLDADGAQRGFAAELAGVDAGRDLAVVRVLAPPPGLRALPLADSSALRVGQPVLAIGGPFGFDHSVSVGVVSALNRGFQSVAGAVIGGGVQTDAALNPGSSGGPLLDLDGRVVGVAAAIFTDSGASAGVGFAVPSATLARSAPQLIADGRVARASLGVSPAADPLARAMRVPEGVMIQAAAVGGGAAVAGLLPMRRGLGGVVAGDVIVGLGSRPVRSLFDLSAALDAAAPGDKVRVAVLRGAGGAAPPERVEVEVTLGAEG
jgi:S1-C subfamily serine protease